VIGDPPRADRVVLRFTSRPGCRLVPVLGPGVHALQSLLAGLPAGRGRGEEDTEVFPGLVSAVPMAPMTSGAQARSR
jgi:hypothetical protein